MIRPYFGVPKFDDGFDTKPIDQKKYNDEFLKNAVEKIYDLNREAQNHKPLDYFENRPLFMDIDPKLIATDQSSLIKPKAKNVYRSTSHSLNTIKTTTGAEDMKAAQKTYNTSVAAAKKKQAAENKKAVLTLKNNGVISKGGSGKNKGMSQQDVWNAFEKGAVAKGNLRKAYYSNRALQLKSQLARQKRLADNERLHPGSRYHQNKYNNMLREYNHLIRSQKGVKPKSTIKESILDRINNWILRLRRKSAGPQINGISTPSYRFR